MLPPIADKVGSRMDRGAVESAGFTRTDAGAQDAECLAIGKIPEAGGLVVGRCQEPAPVCGDRKPPDGRRMNTGLDLQHRAGGIAARRGGCNRSRRPRRQDQEGRQPLGQAVPAPGLAPGTFFRFHSPRNWTRRLIGP